MSTVAKVITALLLLGAFFLTPWSPLQAAKNGKNFSDIQDKIGEYSEISEESNSIKLRFEEQRSASAPALYEPAKAVEVISSITGTIVNEICVLQMSGSTIKNVGQYSETLPKDEIHALQFTVTVGDINTFLAELDKQQYMVEVIKISPPEKTVIVNISFIGGKE